MGNTYSHPSLPAPAAWSDSQLDICLDQLGTAEGVVWDQEVELAVLRAALMALSSPWVVVGLAAGFSLLAVFEVVRLIWYLCTGHVENSFPLDRFCGWFLRRVWRVLRFPFVVLAEQMFGRRAAEGVRNQIDQLAVSPVQQQEQPPPYSVREDHRRAVPVFQPYQPRPAVVGRDLEDVESAASTISIPPPPPPLSASTIYHSAREAPPERRTAADIRASAASLQLLRRLLEQETVGKSLDGQTTRSLVAPPSSPQSSSAPAAVLSSPQAVNLSRWSARSDVSTLNFC